jgi:hypothetical protein
MRMTIVLLFVGAFGLLGCNVVSSCNILTTGIYFDYEVTVENGQVTAIAALWVGDEPRGTSVELECSDQISVNGTVLHRKQGVFVYYENTVEPADTYEFTFTREGQDPYVSTVQTPPALTILTPAEAEEISRQTEFDITWEANGAGEWLDLWITGPCIADTGDQVPDNGSYTVNAGILEIPEKKQNEPADECEVAIALVRTQTGALDAGLNGRIRAFSVGRVNIWSLP